MKIKTGDSVKILSGNSKGKTGKVVRAFPKTGMVIVEGINMHKRHKRPTREGTKGQVIEIAHPVQASNVVKV